MLYRDTEGLVPLGARGAAGARGGALAAHGDEDGRGSVGRLEGRGVGEVADGVLPLGGGQQMVLESLM